MALNKKNTKQNAQGPSETEKTKGGSSTRSSNQGRKSGSGGDKKSNNKGQKKG
jgi:hypothetical protein